MGTVKRYSRRVVALAGVSTLVLAGAVTAVSTRAGTTTPAPRCHYRVVSGQYLPDPACTPGTTNPLVTQETIRATICVSGWTRTVRPSTTVTGPMKRASARDYGYGGPTAIAEFDHLISLELGGAPSDTHNLWVEPPLAGATSFSNPKDAVENRLHARVCAGTMSLAEAQRRILTDWTTALN